MNICFTLVLILLMFNVLRCVLLDMILLKDSNIEANEYSASLRKDFPRGLALNMILPTLSS